MQIAAAVLAIALPAPLPAQEQPAPVRATAEVLVDVVGNPTGGLRREVAGVFLAQGTLVLDGYLLLGIEGLSASGTVMGTAGAQPSDFVGDLQGVSNIAAPNDVRPYELWVQQNLAGGRLSVLAGLYDVNSELDVLHTAALFVNSSFGLGPDLGLSGPNGLPTFPATGLGVRLAMVPVPKLRLRLVVADGSPGSRQDPRAFHPSWKRGEDGSFVMAEGSYLLGPTDPVGLGPTAAEPRRVIGRLGEPHEEGKIGVGVWRHLSHGFPFPDWGWGGYLLAERRLMATGAGQPELGVFARLGFNTATRSPVRRYVGGGFTLHGLRAPRSGSSFGLGLAMATPRVPERPVSWEPPASDATEVVLETTLRTPLAEELYMQPSLQWVLSPAAAPGAENAWVATLRVGFVP